MALVSTSEGHHNFKTTIHEVGRYGKKGDSAGNYTCKRNIYLFK